MKWRLFICSDCDTPQGVVIIQVPDDAPQVASCEFTHCPGCNSYLSFTDMGEVEVTGTALVHLQLR